jgi:hypothetical protein
MCLKLLTYQERTESSYFARRVSKHSASQSAYSLMEGLVETSIIPEYKVSGRFPISLDDLERLIGKIEYYKHPLIRFANYSSEAYLRILKYTVCERTLELSDQECERRAKWLYVRCLVCGLLHSFGYVECCSGPRVYCIWCSAENAPVSKFCKYCGTLLVIN